MLDLDKDLLINRRWGKFSKVNHQEFQRRWQLEKRKRKHLISVGNVIGQRFSWNIRKIAQWALSLGFDGLELRASDLFPNPELNIDCELPSEIVIGIHLSDKACWTSLWSQNPEVIKQSFGNLKIAQEYLSATNKQEMLKRWQCEINFGLKLNARYYVFHGSEIDYDHILQAKPQDKKLILEAVSDVIKSLDFKGRLLAIENAPLHESGIHNWQDFVRLKRKIGPCKIVLDTSHLQMYLYSKKKNNLKTEVRKLRKILEIAIIHLSESQPRKSAVINPCVPSDFWQKRALAYQIIVDDHLPTGVWLKNPQGIIQENQAKIIVHELKLENFDHTQKALQIQQGNLVGLDV